MASTLITVLGVHRSGTSLLAKGLQAVGALAGSFEDVRDLDNPEGYAEYPAVRQFNDRLLAHLGSSWDNWGFRASTVEWRSSALLPWHDEAVALLRRAVGGAPFFVVKDPRWATLAPFWECVVPDAGFELRRILIVRDPAEVSESQLQRVGRRPYEFPVIADRESMAALWVVTMSEVLAALADDMTLLVSHAALMATPAATISAAGAFAGLQVCKDSVDHFVARTFNQELYRAKPSEGGQEDGIWMSGARELFKELLNGACPRLLTSADARGILRSQITLEPLLQTLPAVKESIARLRGVSEARQQRIYALSNLIWALSPVAVTGSAAKLNTAIDRALEIADQSDLPRTSFAVAHTVGRMLLHAGRKTAATVWLDRIRGDFGRFQEFSELEEKVKMLIDDSKNIGSA